MENFYDGFLERFKTNGEKESLKEIIKDINNINPRLEEWGSKELGELFTNFHSVSNLSLLKYDFNFKHIHKYYCDKKGLEHKEIPFEKNIEDYVDLKKLREETITYEDYLFIRDELEVVIDGGRSVNTRDRVLFELAWEGLSNTEIRNLKESDIDFQNDTKAVLKLEKRDVSISDKRVIEDMKKCIDEYEYFRMDKTPSGGIATRVYLYKDSPYLIKPIAITATDKDADKQTVGALPTVFKRIMRRLASNTSRISRNADGTEIKLDLEYLTIESIRRSRIVWLLGHQDIDHRVISRILNDKRSRNFTWLKSVAKKIYQA